MKTNDEQIRVRVKDGNGYGGFDVEMYLSGRREYVRSYGYSHALHNLFMQKDWTLGELRRLTPKDLISGKRGERVNELGRNERKSNRNNRESAYRSVQHLLKVIDWRLEELEEDRIYRLREQRNEDAA